MRKKVDYIQDNFGECTIHGDRFDDGTFEWVAAWGKDGKWWPLTDEDRHLDRDALLRKLHDAAEAGIYKCTTCGAELQKSQVAGWPLFCGVACGPCWEKHLDHLKQQRATGQVCRMCCQPYDNCCC